MLERLDPMIRELLESWVDGAIQRAEVFKHVLIESDIEPNAETVTAFTLGMLACTVSALYAPVTPDREEIKEEIREYLSTLDAVVELVKTRKDEILKALLK
jgi:hypothetical protein